LTTPDETRTDIASDLPRLVLTIEEAAKVLRIGRTTMFALVSDGEIRSFLIGRSRRIPLAAIDEYVKRKDAESASTGLAA
jgi:excisionase family DNA binding protein